MKVVACALCAWSANARTQPLLHVKSPSGHISVALRIDEGRVFWQASLDGHTVLESAPLGIGISGEAAVPDETVVLPPSKIGAAAVFARRKGDIWFLACMNGDDPRTMEIPLRFLGPGTWSARTVNDVPERYAAAAVDQRMFTNTGSIHLTLRAGGGFVAEFRRQ